MEHPGSTAAEEDAHASSHQRQGPPALITPPGPTSEEDAGAHTLFSTQRHDEFMRSGLPLTPTKIMGDPLSLARREMQQHEAWKHAEKDSEAKLAQVSTGLSLRWG